MKNKIMKRWIGICILSLIIVMNVTGQADTIDYEQEVDSDELRLALINKHYGDSIVLRWAPSRIDGWITGMNSGYRIHRLQLDDAYEPVNDWDTLIAPLIMPYSIEKFKQEIAKHPGDDFLAAAAESMYGFQLEYKDETYGKNIFDLADEYNDRYSICLISADLSSRGAEGLGWRFIDKNIVKGQKYVYRVFAPGEDTISIRLDATTLAEIDTLALNSPEITEIIEKEGQIDLKLSREVNDEYFSAYLIERSGNEGLSWDRLTDIPWVQPLTDHEIGNKDYMVYRDTGLVNYTPYLYRVIGLNAFGEQSEASESVSAMARDKTPPRIPEKFMAKMNEEMQMEINWEYDEEPEDLGGFILARSIRPFDPQTPVHEDMLDPQTRSFIDASPNSIANNFYTLYVLDTAQNVSYTQATYGSYIDSIPPSPPTGMTYEIDSSGNTVISWNLGQEEDLLGYHVYFANSRRHMLGNVTKMVLQDTVFKDTFDLQSLTETGYYRITAIDFNYNVSDFSDWLEVVKPDIVPPSGPIITGHRSLTNGIAIFYEESSSKDVESYILERKTDGKWKTVSQISAGKSAGSIVDTSRMEQGSLYRYQVRAIDDAQNVSNETYVYTARSKLPVLTGKIKTFDIDSDERKAEIKWSYVGRDSDLVKLYRSTAGRPFRLIRTFEAAKRLGKDFTIRNREQLEYRIVLETKDGIVLDSSPIRRI